jgi:hypothetical protein
VDTAGFPRVLPIGFWWDGAAIVVCTATTAPKVEAIRARPKVGLVIDEGDTPATARALMLRGSAEVEIVDGVPDEFIAASTKRLSGADAGQYAAIARQTYPAMARIRIPVEWARFYDFGAGRLPQFLSQLAG